MDAAEARKGKVRDWINQQFDGNVSAFVRYYGMKPSMASYLSQILSGHRKLGERAARKLEIRCEKPERWLDVPANVTSPEIPIFHFDREACQRLPQHAKEQIEAYIAFTVARYRRENVTPVLNLKSVASPSPHVKDSLKKAASKSLRKGRQIGRSGKAG